jgi:hypothetical protein
VTLASGGDVMDQVIIPSPGMPDGPCRGSCSHPKCHALRSLADDQCAHCGVRFGFGARITGDPPVHMRCAAAAAAPAAHTANHAYGNHGHHN